MRIRVPAARPRTAEYVLWNDETSNGSLTMFRRPTDVIGISEIEIPELHLKAQAECG